MAQINKPDEYFNTVLYTGDMVDGDGTGHTQSITGTGFTADWVWHKGRSNARQHMIVDSVRGTTNYNFLSSQDANGEITVNTNGAIKSIDSDGITLENGTDSSSKSNNAGANGENYVFWNWLAGGTPSSNTDGSITSNVSASTTSGFSIVSYTGTGAIATVGHGLNSAPKMIFIKNRNLTSPNEQDWSVYNKDIGAGNFLFISRNNASASAPTRFNSTDPTSSVFTLGTHASGNGSSNTYIAYCFAEKKGFSKIGSYTGNGSTDGTFVYTGFKPTWVLVKRTDTTGNWYIWDTKRNTFNVMNFTIYPNSGTAEITASDLTIDSLSNGFKIRGTSIGINASGGTYIYMAFAENPLVGTNNIPATAR